jgi:copper(I)-binding protein
MKTTNHHISRVAVAAAATAVVIAGALTAQPRAQQTPPGADARAIAAPLPGASGEAVSVRLSEAELREAADVVVRGTVVSDEVVAFRANREVPEAAQADPLYRHGSFHDVRVRVNEYVKGDGPRVVSVRRRDIPADAPGADDLPKPRVGEEYTLYLDTGRGVWQGGYLLLGEQGLKRQ